MYLSQFFVYNHVIFRFSSVCLCVWCPKLWIVFQKWALTCFPSLTTLFSQDTRLLRHLHCEAGPLHICPHPRVQFPPCLQPPGACDLWSRHSLPAGKHSLGWNHKYPFKGSIQSIIFDSQGTVCGEKHQMLYFLTTPLKTYSFCLHVGERPCTRGIQSEHTNVPVVQEVTLAVWWLHGFRTRERHRFCRGYESRVTLMSSMTIPPPLGQKTLLIACFKWRNVSFFYKRHSVCDTITCTCTVRKNVSDPVQFCFSRYKQH